MDLLPFARLSRLSLPLLNTYYNQQVKHLTICITIFTKKKQYIKLVVSHQLINVCINKTFFF